MNNKTFSNTKNTVSSQEGIFIPNNNQSVRWKFSYAITLEVCMYISVFFDYTHTHTDHKMKMIRKFSFTLFVYTLGTLFSRDLN